VKITPLFFAEYAYWDCYYWKSRLRPNLSCCTLYHNIRGVYSCL